MRLTVADRLSVPLYTPEQIAEIMAIIWSSAGHTGLKCDGAAERLC